jgi:hypothetical protein
VTTLVKELDATGSLHGLRHGFKFDGKTFRLAWFKPARGANWGVWEPFGKTCAGHSPGDSLKLARAFCSACCSASASKKASVDSAPWFWLTRSRCRPSRQPPVPGS